jgi:nitrogen fixation NifU-like protein
MSSGRLYDEVIRRHNNQPFNFQRIENCKHLVAAHNFICGDRFDICLKFDQNEIRAVHFFGFGCAVSKASTSVLAQCLEGKSRSEAISVCNLFLRLLKNEAQADEPLPSDFQSFRAVQEFPARYDCAALAWEEVLKFLETGIDRN